MYMTRSEGKKPMYYSNTTKAKVDETWKAMVLFEIKVIIMKDIISSF